MKRKVVSWIKISLEFLLRLLSKCVGPTRLLNLQTEATEDAGYFVTYHYRPQQAALVRSASDSVREHGPLAIVMQGPILHEDCFTLETLKIYQRHFPGAIIILSTWENEPAAVIRQIQDSGIVVILNTKPAYAGISNINLQITSTRSGMLAAKDSNAEYALKARTDQRMYAPNLGNFLYNIIETFPVTGHWPKQKKRIVGCGTNTFKYRMYGLSDMFIYGHMDDMLLYWDIGLDERVFDEKQQAQAAISLRTFALWRVCEVYLTTEYLMKIGRELQWSLQDSWGVFSNHFCVVDKQQIDLFWPKYGRSEYRWLNYGADVRMEELSFRDWFNIYTSLSSIEVNENLLDA